MVIDSFISHNTKKLALLIDPDKFDQQLILQQIDIANKSNVDYIFLGGSLITNDGVELSIKLLKENTNIPIIIFPGDGTHIHKDADAILFLSLISGRNADFLIGNQVRTAATIKAMGIESIATGYMLIESGKLTAAQYMSNTMPIPQNKSDIAVATAVAGEMLGLKSIYMDAGSGADNAINSNMIANVKAAIGIPLIIGGGIRDAQTAKRIVDAGADIIVVGNAAENNPDIIKEIKKAIS